MASVTAKLRRLDLSPQESSVAALYALDGLPVSEVGDRSGLAAETVRSYLKRARQKYRDRGVDASTRHKLRLALLADQETPPTPE